MPANAMVAPPEVDGRIFYDESVRGFNFRRERVPLAVALKTLLKYQHDDRPPTIYIGSTTIDTYLPGLRAENDLDLGDRDPLASVWIGNRSRIPAHQHLPATLACVAVGRRRVPSVVALHTLTKDPHAAPPPPSYSGWTTLDTYLPGLGADNDLDVGDRDPLARVWISNRSRIPAHQDLPDNLACVAVGRRRVTLFPPDQLANLYIGPLDFTPAGQAISLVDFAAPDLARFPRFAEALRHAQVAELGPGDAVFIPSMW